MYKERLFVCHIRLFAFHQTPEDHNEWIHASSFPNRSKLEYGIDFFDDPDFITTKLNPKIGVLQVLERLSSDFVRMPDDSNYRQLIRPSNRYLRRIKDRTPNVLPVDRYTDLVTTNEPSADTFVHSKSQGGSSTSSGPMLRIPAPKPPAYPPPAGCQAEQRQGVLVPPDPKTLRQIYVGGLKRTTREETFYEYFAEYGQIEVAKLLRDHEGGSKGCGIIAFVDFSDLPD